MKRITSAFALFVPVALVWACGSSGDGGDGAIVGGDNSGATSNTGGSIGGSLGTGGSVVGSGGTLGTELCGDAGCACSNGLDDDDDGFADGLDAECTGPYDDDEGTFATG